MSPRKSTMLEAFHSSGPAGADASNAPLPHSPAQPSRSALPKPRAASKGAGASSAFQREGSALQHEGSALQHEGRPVFVLAALAAAGLLIGAFWLGRATAPGVPTVLASPGVGPAGTSSDAASAEWRLDRQRDAERAPTAALPTREDARPSNSTPATLSQAADPQLDEFGRTADDRAFYDKENRFTVRAIRYANTQNGWKHALGVYRYLREQGLPAIAPIDQGDLIVICLGAEPKREGRLAELRRALEELPGPPPRSERGAFAGAYYDNIDHLIERP